MKVRGVVKGRTIEVTDAMGLPEGQQVEIEIQAVHDNKMDKDLVRFRCLEDRMEAEQFHEWVVEDYKGEVVGAYDSQDDAMDAAVARFGDVLMMMTQTDDQPRIIIAPAFVDAQGNAYTPKNVPSLLSPSSAGVGPPPEIEYISVERDAVAVDADD